MTMKHSRSEILEWAGQGRIAPRYLRRALELGEALPTADEWRRFLDRLFLFMGAAMLAASITFFLAYNWQELGRFTKFGLVEALTLAALAFVWRLGLERASGKAALLVAALSSAGADAGALDKFHRSRNRDRIVHAGLPVVPDG
jgi:uncharacterized membrane protein